jgi:hypothetical protein
LLEANKRIDQDHGKDYRGIFGATHEGGQDHRPQQDQDQNAFALGEQYAPWGADRWLRHTIGART